MISLPRLRRTPVFALAVGLGCSSPRDTCRDCAATVVVSATGEPTSLVPPLVDESVGRDVSDLVFERLAELAPGHAPIDTSAYRPRLAVRWERIDSLTWRFHLRPGARWHDGTPVTADDVRFSFEVFADSTLDAPARGYLVDRVTVSVEDAATVRLRFAEASPEQLYDATYHVRIMPKHLWERVPRGAWRADTALGRLVGSGPYRLRRWQRGQSLVLEAESLAWRRPHISRVVWRFSEDPDAALNLVLSGEADLLETIGPPRNAARFAGDSAYDLRTYPGAVYGFLAFRVADSLGRPHPVFGYREVRRALAMAVDRSMMAHALFGPESRPPAGPVSELLWINAPDIAVLPFDANRAARILDSLGWRRTPESGVRQRAGSPLGFDILVPSSSSSRRQAAIMLQESWRQAGFAVTVTSVEFPVFQERIMAGRFDTYIGAYLDEPSARGLADQWSREGWSTLNYGRYVNRTFDELLSRAARTADPAAARRYYREALDTLNADAPALFLYSPANVAAVRRTLARVELDPYSWLAGLPDWQVREGGGASLGARIP